MHRFILMLVLVFGSLVLVPQGVHAAPKSTALYHASFKSNGLKGWHTSGGAGWTINSKGIVRFGGSSAAALFAPISATALQNFGVEASIKEVGTTTQQFSDFGLVVRATGAPSSGVLAGSVVSAGSDLNGPILIWGNQSVGGSDVSLHAGYNTYRLDVHGTDYTFTINGINVVQFAIPNVSRGAHIGLWAAARPIAVRSFTVTRLGNGAPLPAMPPLRAVNLGPADVPSALSIASGHFFTNEQLARLSKVPVAHLTAQGLRLSYQTMYSVPPTPTTGPFAAISYLYAYTLQSAAQQDLTSDWASFQKADAGNPNYSASDVPNLGDEAHVLSYNYTETGYGGSFAATLVGIFFRRGAYMVNLFEDFVAGSFPMTEMINQAVMLAAKVDQHIQAAG